MKSKISLDEEAQNEIDRKNRFRDELNKTSDMMKKIAAQYKIMVENKNIESIDLETQEKIIKVAKIMESFMDGQRLVISNLLNK